MPPPASDIAFARWLAGRSADRLPAVARAAGAWGGQG